MKLIDFKEKKSKKDGTVTVKTLINNLLKIEIGKQLIMDEMREYD